MKGEVWAERHIIAQALSPVSPTLLTPKEAQVLSLIKLGLSNKQIATRLGNSETTIKSHVRSILEKFGSKNRVGLLLHTGLLKKERGSS